MMAWHRWSGAMVTALAALAAPSCGTSVETPGGQGGAGGAAEEPCSTNAICDDQNPCTADSCGPGEVCTYDPAPMEGMEMPDGIAGNCHKLACHQGAPETVPDDSDLPESASPCTIGVCNDGTPTQVAVPDGTSCTVQGSPGTCHQGQCQAFDCECPMPGPCVTTSCDPATSQCVLTPLPDGTPDPSGDVAGDCHVLLCIGGMATAVVDDTDLPFTTQDCVTPACDNGLPATPPVAAGAPCNTFMGNHLGLCDGAGACVQCLQDTDCGANQVCVNGKCQ